MMQFRLLFLAALMLFTVSAATTIAIQNGQAAPEAASAAGAKDKDEELAAAGKKATEELCTQCHGLEDVTAQRRTPRQWNDTVAEMLSRGASGTDDQVATVKRYLLRHYGNVRVNTASAADLSSVLGFSAKDADAIVEYRKAHGNFADAAAVAKVPDIDKTKLEEQPDALLFD